MEKAPGNIIHSSDTASSTVNLWWESHPPGTGTQDVGGQKQVVTVDAWAGEAYKRPGGFLQGGWLLAGSLVSLTNGSWHSHPLILSIQVSSGIFFSGTLCRCRDNSLGPGAVSGGLMYVSPQSIAPCL